ncbi:MAG: hypothetical protein FD187_1773 [bacterium]|nr:MAG: hypothetical protein FD142_726 [bacterium]KAF0148727.1 MAG: hypothetical protein FD187_1773 [bacterium]KAF0168217.1 MAG: hypothetical protein FD158_1610 [bacterium]
MNRAGSLKKQTCVLWIQAAGGYVAQVFKDGYHVTQDLAAAMRMREDKASEAAAFLYTAHRIKAAVRAVH